MNRNAKQHRCLLKVFANHPIPLLPMWHGTSFLKFGFKGKYIDHIIPADVFVACFYRLICADGSLLRRRPTIMTELRSWKQKNLWQFWSLHCCLCDWWYAGFFTKQSNGQKFPSGNASKQYANLQMCFSAYQMWLMLYERNTGTQSSMAFLLDYGSVLTKRVQKKDSCTQ